MSAYETGVDTGAANDSDNLVGPEIDIDLPKSAVEVVEALNNYAVWLKDNSAIPTAISALKRALVLMPDTGTLWQNLGTCYLKGLEPELGRDAFLKAVELDPNYFYNYSNLGLTHCYLKEYDTAEKYFKLAESLATTQEYKLALQWQRAISALERGRWAEGFKQYEARIQMRGKSLYPSFACPRWEGQDLNDKVIYISPEQGLGDRLLFARFFQVLKDRYPRCQIITCLGPEYWDLFWEFRDIVSFMPSGTPWPGGIDYYDFQASLPLHLGMSSPTQVPPDSGHFLRRITKQQNLGNFTCPRPHLGGLKVGIAWTGNPEQDKNHERSVPLAKFLQLQEDPYVTLFGFQVGPEAGDIDRIGAGQLVYNFSDEFAKHGIVAAGAAMMEMDLIITVCTATAHLAGVLGVPCWLLLCHNPYWVWLQDSPVEARERTVWYPTTRIFRQRKLGDWDPVFQDVKDQLQLMLQQSKLD